MLRGLAVTGTVITSAGIVLAGTFSALAVLPLVSLTEIGFTIAMGVLLDTFIVRTLLVPALVLEIGDRVWWPSSLVHDSGTGAAEKPASEGATETDVGERGERDQRRSVDRRWRGARIGARHRREPDDRSAAWRLRLDWRSGRWSAWLSRRGRRCMSERTAAGIVLIATPVLFNVGFTLLAQRFDYPDILRRPTHEVLERFRAGGTGLILIWWVFALSAVLFAALAVLLAIAVDDADPTVVVSGSSSGCSRRSSSSSG